MEHTPARIWRHVVLVIAIVIIMIIVTGSQATKNRQPLPPVTHIGDIPYPRLRQALEEFNYVTERYSDGPSGRSNLSAVIDMYYSSQRIKMYWDVLSLRESARNLNSLQPLILTNLDMALVKLDWINDAQPGYEYFRCYMKIGSARAYVADTNFCNP